MGRALAVALAAGLCGVASAQIAPPPTQAPDPTPVAETPAVPPPVNNPQRPQPQQQTAEERARQTLRRDPSSVELPPLPYDSLVSRDTDGRVVRLEENAHFAALAVNPMLDDSSMERALGVIAARRDKVERRVAEHVDLIQQVLGGAIDRVDIARPDSIRDVISVVRPFQELGHLSDDLKDQGILNEQQWAFNWKIAQEYTSTYQQDVLAAAAENPDPNAPSPQTLFTRLVMNDFLREPLEVYHSLLVEAAGRPDEVMALVPLTTEQEGEASRLRGAIAGAGDDEAKAAAVQELITFLTPEQRKAFVQAILDSR